MTNDERFERKLRDEGADYRLPASEVPRDAMWDAIRARRAGLPAGVLGRGAPAPRHISRTWVWTGMAATLVFGVAIGRLAWQHGPSSTIAVITPAPVSAPPTTSAPSAVATGQPAERPAAMPVAATSRPRTIRPDDGAPLADARSTTYSLAAARHLADVDALLTSYGASASDVRNDSLLAKWAKGLLSNTRLLLDSPAADDPARARLLSDLELILVQLVQRSPGGSAEERATVERTLDKTNLIPRLRSAVPARAHSGTG